MQLRMQINVFIEDWRIQKEISGIVQTITLYPVQMTMWMLMQKTSCDQQSVPAVSLCTCPVLIKQQPLGTQKVSSNSISRYAAEPSFNRYFVEINTTSRLRTLQQTQGFSPSATRSFRLIMQHVS
jgi:hypothetical protein